VTAVVAAVAIAAQTAAQAPAQTSPQTETDAAAELQKVQQQKRQCSNKRGHAATAEAGHGQQKRRSNNGRSPATAVTSQQQQSQCSNRKERCVMKQLNTAKYIVELTHEFFYMTTHHDIY
jgi:hypothetical protein